MTVFKTARGRPSGQEGDIREEPMNRHHRWLIVKVIEEMRDFLKEGVGTLCGDHEFGLSGFIGRRLDTRGCYLIGLYNSRLSVCFSLGLGVLRPGSLPGGSQFGRQRPAED
jgi:hypothetical protein